METGYDTIEKGTEDAVTEDEWGWGGPLVTVQGFGFLPAKVHQAMLKMAKVRNFIET